MLTPILIATLGLAMAVTAFLSGLFGMAGGMILIGILLAILPLPEAMALHAVTQMASNGWRGLLWRRHIRPGAAVAYLIGASAAMVAWSFWRYVPSAPTAMLFLGVTPFAVKLLPQRLQPDAGRKGHGLVYGAICMSLLLLTGVVGPLIDTYFLGGKLDRREIVATKALCQIFGHGVKLVYFGSIVDQAATLDPKMMAVAIVASMLGTSAARRFLEAMSDAQFRTWATRIIVAISGFYVLQGLYLLFIPAFVPALAQP